MTHPTRRQTFLGLASVALWPATLAAAPVRYVLDPKKSKVGFIFTLAGAAQKGTMPVKTADIVVDPANLAASKVDVTVDVTGARTGLPFATEALVSPQVLDAARFPTIRFQSIRVKLSPSGRLSDGARITGRLTMHGVTRTISLDANLYRERGSAADDLSRLTVQLSGALSRNAFGAAGYPDLVTDTVRLDIRAAIRAAG